MRMSSSFVGLEKGITPSSPSSWMRNHPTGTQASRVAMETNFERELWLDTKCSEEMLGNSGVRCGLPGITFFQTTTENKYFCRCHDHAEKYLKEIWADGLVESMLREEKKSPTLYRQLSQEEFQVAQIMES